MKLLIAIVNYRTPLLAIECLRSIESQVRAIGSCRVSLVDGHSGDDSVEVLDHALTMNEWRDWCDFRPLEINGGFAFANNEAIRPYLESSDPPDYVLLLNPDTLARPGAVLELLRHMESHPEIGIAGSRTEWPDGSPQTSAFRFPGVASEFETQLRFGPVSRLLRRWIVAPVPPEAEWEADWVVGASMMIRREVFDRIGLLDDYYFMYYEEVDFCLRARRAGFRVRYVPQSRIVHLIGKSSGVTSRETRNKRRPAYWFESRRRYFTKNYGLLYAMFADLAAVIGFALWRIRRFVQRKPDPDPAHFLVDLFRHSVFLKGSSLPKGSV
jgi:GT2 family glycosyltransferase